MIKIAVLGYGVVGSGTVDVLNKNKDTIKQNAGQEVQVKYILDIREFSDNPYKELFVDDFETIVDDPEITIVVETVGGVEAALDYTRRSLNAGKNVVTSNKELVAEYGGELLKLAKEKNVNYLFEASVGGGIPVVRPLVQCMSANEIREIYGILNGTTNYILTDMEKNGAEFAEALCDAQKKGYAESDPTSDIEGHDACRKICILSSIATGKHIHPNEVPTTGIANVTKEDMAYAAQLGYKIKLLGRARMIGEKIAVYVAPHLVNAHSIMAEVNDVMNGVVVRGNAVGNVVFCGAGAGKLPTASAVVADIIDGVKHLHARRWISWDDDCVDMIENPEVLESAWYIRTDATREKAKREFGNVIFAEDTGDQTVFITTVINEKKVRELLGNGITALSQYRVLGDY